MMKLAWWAIKLALNKMRNFFWALNLNFMFLFKGTQRLLIFKLLLPIISLFYADSLSVASYRFIIYANHQSA